MIIKHPIVAPVLPGCPQLRYKTFVFKCFEADRLQSRIIAEHRIAQFGAVEFQNPVAAFSQHLPNLVGPPSEQGLEMRCALQHTVGT